MSADPMTDVAAAEAFFASNAFTGHRAKTRWGERVRELEPETEQGKPRCCHALYENYDYHQCSKAASKTDAAGHPWCGVHSPVAVANRKAASAARSAETYARWRHEGKLRAEAAEQKTAYPALLAALREIAAGHNDPRTLAHKVLSALFPAEHSVEVGAMERHSAPATDEQIQPLHTPDTKREGE